MVDDSVKEEDESVMNSVQLDDEYSARRGIVQISKVQNTEFILEEAGSNKNEDIVTDSLIDGEIVNEIKKINDKLRGKGDVESEDSSDTEENQNIRTRKKPKFVDVHCIETKRCCDARWNSGICVY